MTKKVIAFAGRQASGKSYRCNKLVEDGYKSIAFADALRKIAFATLGIPYEEGMKHYDELKITPCVEVEYTNDKDELHPIKVTSTFRRILERLGTDGIRQYDNDFWVKCLIHDIEEAAEDKICVSDLRFYNEYAGLKKYCDENNYEFEFIFCDYHSPNYDPDNYHASARLANFLCEIGYKDGQPIKDEDMQAYIESMEELNKAK